VNVIVAVVPADFIAARLANRVPRIVARFTIHTPVIGALNVIDRQFTIARVTVAKVVTVAVAAVFVPAVALDSFRDQKSITTITANERAARAVQVTVDFDIFGRQFTTATFALFTHGNSSKQGDKTNRQPKPITLAD
jgi:hypothetical protein